jgi:hypothetical protein
MADICGVRLSPFVATATFLSRQICRACRTTAAASAVSATQTLVDLTKEAAAQDETVPGRAEKAASSWSTRIIAAFSTLMILHPLLPLLSPSARLPGQTSLAEEFILPLECNDGLLALLRDYGIFDLALLDIENCIRRTALRKDYFVLSIFGDPSTVVRNTIGSKGTSFTFFAMTNPLHGVQRAE